MSRILLLNIYNVIHVLEIIYIQNNNSPINNINKYKTKDNKKIMLMYMVSIKLSGNISKREIISRDNV